MLLLVCFVCWWCVVVVVLLVVVLFGGRWDVSTWRWVGDVDFVALQDVVGSILDTLNVTWDWIRATSTGCVMRNGMSVGGWM